MRHRPGLRSRSARRRDARGAHQGLPRPHARPKRSAPGASRWPAAARRALPCAGSARARSRRSRRSRTAPEQVHIDLGDVRSPRRSRLVTGPAKELQQCGRRLSPIPAATLAALAFCATAAARADRPTAREPQRSHRPRRRARRGHSITHARPPYLVRVSAAHGACLAAAVAGAAHASLVALYPDRDRLSTSTTAGWPSCRPVPVRAGAATGEASRPRVRALNLAGADAFIATWTQSSNTSWRPVTAIRAGGARADASDYLARPCARRLCARPRVRRFTLASPTAPARAPVRRFARRPRRGRRCAERQLQQRRALGHRIGRVALQRLP